MLCLPYSYDNNDFVSPPSAQYMINGADRQKFSQPAGWRSAKIYGEHLIAAFDELWDEAERSGSDKVSL
jgi:hypothetical protein